MHTKRELKKMTTEELRLIALEKNAKKLATTRARYAQEIIWSRRLHVREQPVDDYDGWDIEIESFDISTMVLYR